MSIYRTTSLTFLPPRSSRDELEALEAHRKKDPASASVIGDERQRRALKELVGRAEAVVAFQVWNVCTRITYIFILHSLRCLVFSPYCLSPDLSLSITRFPGCSVGPVQDRGVVGLVSQLDHILPPLLARGKKDTQPALALALARSPNKCAQATAALTLLAQQLTLVKHLPLQVTERPLCIRCLHSGAGYTCPV